MSILEVRLVESNVSFEDAVAAVVTEPAPLESPLRGLRDPSGRRVLDPEVPGSLSAVSNPNFASE